MTDVGSVKYKVELDNSGLDKDTQTTEKTISSKLDAISGKISQSFGYQVLKDIGGAFLNLGKQAVQGFTDMSKAAMESTAALEQNMGGVETLFKGSADTVIANAKRAYTTAGMSANQYMETVTSFSASLLQSLGGDTEKAAAAADQAIIDMSDNANKMGTSIDSIQAAYQGFAKQNYTMLDNLKLGYGGTKTEMERLLADASKLSGVKYDISNLNDVYEAIHVIQGELGITGTTAAEASATIEGSMNAAKAAYDNFLNGTITGEEFAATLATAAENVASNLAVIIQNFADQLPGIVAVISERLPGMLATLGPPILDALMAIAKSALTVGEDIAKSIADGVKQNGPEILTQAGEIIIGFLDKITTAYPDLVSKGYELAGKLADGLLQNAPAAITAIGNLLTMMLNNLLAGLPQMMESGVQLIQHLAEGLIQNGPAVLTSIAEVLLQLITTIAEHLPEILQKGIELIGQLAAGLIQAIPDAVAGMGQVLQNLGDAVKAIDWPALGKAIIDGIIAGLKNAGEALFGAMKGLATEALGAAKGVLGIKSPSRVFRDEVGAMIPEGVAVGVEENAYMVSDAVESMASGLAVDADLNLPDMSAIGADIGATISATTSQTIEVPVMLDGREIARASAWYMNEQLAWEAR
jgi:phage-related protein